MWKNRKGFSLIEAVIVIALISILVGSSVVMIGHLRYTSTKEVVEKVNGELNSLRLETMSQPGQKYLYIYKSGEKYYTKVLDKEPGAVSGTDLDEKGTLLCTDSVEIYKDGAGSPVGNTGSSCIHVAYTKSGLFKDGSTKLIEIKGSGSYTIHLDGVSGRHYD